MKEKAFIIIILLLLIMAGIVHERIVASRDKGLAVDWNANHQITGDVDMGQYSWLNQVIENRVDFPAGPVEGQIIWRSDLNNFYIFDGAGWVIHTPAIPKGTYYWSCAGINFISANPDVDDIGIGFPPHGTRIINVNGIAMVAPVFLPHGAVVTKCVIYGGGVVDNWSLVRSTLAATASVSMATAALNVEDATITNPTIDNQVYYYWLYVPNCQAASFIRGARITYTL